jgi:hypothetical protein
VTDHRKSREPSPATVMNRPGAGWLLPAAGGGAAAGLLVIAPTLPDGGARVAAYLVAVVAMVAVTAGFPVLLRSHHGSKGPGPRSAVAVGTFLGLFVGGLIAVVPAGLSTGQGQPGAVAGGRSGGLAQIWESAVALADGTVPGGSDRLVSFAVDDFMDRSASLSFIGDDGTVYTSNWSVSDGWGDVREDTTGSSPYTRRDSFGAAQVSADLDEVAADALEAGGDVVGGLTFLGVEIERAEPGLVIDVPGREHVVGAVGADGADGAEVVIGVSLRDDPDTNIGVFTVQADSAGGLPAALAHPADPVATFGRVVTAYRAAGVDPAQVRLHEFTSTDDLDWESRISVEVPGRRYYLDWATGGFAELEVADITGGAEGPVLADVDATALGRAVDDARARGNLDPKELDDVSIDISDRLGEDAYAGRLTARITVSTDPDASGIYGVVGDEAGRYLGPV